MHPEVKPIMLSLWAPPGVGKSTTAAMVFNVLKVKGYKAELVMEFAKDITYEKNWKALEDQFFVGANQERRNSRLIGEVDIIVTDSPPGLGLLYCPARDKEIMRDLVLHWRTRYNNVDWYLTSDPDRKYQTFGRTQTEEESAALGPALLYEMSRLGVTHHVTRADALAGTYIADALIRRIQRGAI